MAEKNRIKEYLGKQFGENNRRLSSLEEMTEADWEIVYRKATTIAVTNFRCGLNSALLELMLPMNDSESAAMLDHGADDNLFDEESLVMIVERLNKVFRETVAGQRLALKLAIRYIQLEQQGFAE